MSVSMAPTNTITKSWRVCLMSSSFEGKVVLILTQGLKGLILIHLNLSYQAFYTSLDY